MKKWLAALFVCVMVFAVGCDNTNNTKTVQSSDLKVAALNGPTGMGIVKLMEDNDKNAYEILSTADEAAVKLTKGEVDIALIPSNLAATLYNKTNGGIKVCAINTLGVLYVVENGNTINSIQDLAGKKVLSSGKGTVPEYVTNYLLQQNGLKDGDVEIEFKAETTEIVAELTNGTSNIAIIPQPMVSAALAANSDLRIALDFNNEWEKTQANTSIVTGVVVATKETIENKKEALDAFLNEYKTSVDYVNNNVEDAAALVEKHGIAKAAIAKKAIPYCNITFVENNDMKEKLSAYLKVLYDQNPKSVGGTLPDDAFYYSR